jgi:uncharacterized membrane protein
VNDDIGPNVDSYFPHLWVQGIGWFPLPMRTLTFSVADVASEDLTKIAGRGRNADSGEVAQVWLWSEESGQSVLEIEGDLRPLRVAGVSNDGQTIVGETLGTPGNLLSRRTVLWESDSGPRFLENADGIGLGIPTTCNSDCSVISGVNFYEPPDVDLEGRAWFITRQGAFGLLDFNQSIADREAVLQTVPQDISSDGTLIVGSVTGAIGQQLVNSGFVWTTSTGIEFATELLAAVGLGNLSWSSLEVRSVSPDGRLLMLAGRLDRGPGFLSLFRTIIIKLE